ncbi:hypothetical protein [Streptomyces sp. UH6]|uniref:hypothetical protein n=1 Tax=Streptomyces sp. UH6 TaxID=2748379 RepID=UPI0015D523ED|nr:hypothetical protein [Streptomyces sp. UH6]NYV73264.1 hypothetical protein [Streptomyces sp. UH6]
MLPHPHPPLLIPTPDPLTPARHITHQHFQPGDRVLVLRGMAQGDLWGDAMGIVAPSWHLPTQEDGWRVRNPHGGPQTYLTAHPRYLIHLRRRCPDCLIHLRAMKEYLLPRFADRTDLIDCGWYTTTGLNQLVHTDDAQAPTA